MKKTIVNNLETLEKVEFYNDLSPKDNLVTAYLLHTDQPSQLMNKELREHIKGRVETCNNRTLHLSPFSTFIK